MSSEAVQQTLQGGNESPGGFIRIDLIDLAPQYIITFQLLRHRLE